MNLKYYIGNIVKEYLKETKQVSDNEDIQQFVDIIDGLDINDEKRAIYIKILKDKFDYDYVEGSDEDYINNASLSELKTSDDFRSYSNFKKYSEKILRLRESNIDYSKFYSHSGSINKSQLIQLLEKYKIKSYFTKTGIYSSTTGTKDDMAIDWAGDIFDKSHILHEVAHFFDNKIHIPVIYSLTEYGLTNQAECTCDSIMLYLLNPQYYKIIFPEIGQYIENNIPDWFVELSRELKSI